MPESIRTPGQNRALASSHSSRYAAAERLRGAKAPTGLRRWPMRSTSVAAGIRLFNTRRRRPTSSITSRWRRLRRSTIEKKPITFGRVAHAAVLQEPIELAERSQGQRRGDQRHEQHVGRLEHALGRQRDARRAVEEHVVVVLAQAVAAADRDGVSASWCARARGRGCDRRSRPARDRGSRSRCP